MKKKMIAGILIVCLLAMPMAVGGSTEQAFASQKLIADFRSGITLGSHVTNSFYSRYYNKGDRIHVDASSTCSFLIGLNYTKTGTNYGVSCVGSCNKYITVPYTGYYRVFVYNKSSGKGTVRGGVYLVN